MASIHLMRHEDRVAIIDTGTQHSLPAVEAALQQIELSYENVDYVVLTHIHLDHAGGAGALMRQCPQAKLVVHERGARHMMDPAKLIAGTVAVYGKAAFEKLYGDVIAVEKDRILVPADGDTLSLSGRNLRFLDSPGHARHHHCIYDEQTNSVFTGDTLGISYPGMRNGDRFYLMPTTTPIQFDPDALHASIDKIMALQPQTLYLTHYSAVQPGAGHIAGLHEQIDAFVSLTEEHAEADESQFVERLSAALTKYLVARCCLEIPQISEHDAVHNIRPDAELNAQGLVFWWNHRRNR